MNQWQARNENENEQRDAIPLSPQFCPQRRWGGRFHRVTTIVVHPDMLDDIAQHETHLLRQVKAVRPRSSLLPRRLNAEVRKEVK